MGNCSVQTLVSILVFLLLLTDQALCSVRHLKKMREFREKLEQKKAAISGGSNNRSNGRVFYPIDYGADPSGAKDSFQAIMAAISDAVKSPTSHTMMPGIKDLGGAVIDLQGGSFIISRPITFPTGIGNLVMQGGSLRASPEFPGNQHLVQLLPPQDSSNKYSDQKDSNFDHMVFEDIIFQDILFDSTMRGGGLAVVSSARIRVLDCFFLRFTTQGIRVVQGHETFISGCFLGQHPTDGKDPGESGFSGTGIDISGNDNSVTDVVIFSAHTGISISGRANIVTGAHCYNKATGHGGVGIYVPAGSAQNRILNPYMDFTGILLEDPDQILVSGGFFLGGGNILIQAKSGRIFGLTIVDNFFSGDGASNNPPSVQLKGGGVWSRIEQVVVDRNVATGMELRSTVAEMVVRGKGKRWVADFSRVLLFPNKINHAFYSVYLKGGGGFTTHAVTNVSRNVVVIESQDVVDAVVSVSVDQYNTAQEDIM